MTVKELIKRLEVHGGNQEVLMYCSRSMNYVSIEECELRKGTLIQKETKEKLKVVKRSERGKQFFVGIV